MASRSQINKQVGTEDREQAERELQQLVDAVPQHIVVLSGEGHRLYGNQAACDYHGLTRDEFLVEPITNCFHPEDIPNYSRIRDSGIAGGGPWEAEARLRRKDGAYRWFLIRGKPLRDEKGDTIRWYLTRTDIEERKVAELELRQFIDVVPQSMCIDDADGAVLYANRRLLDYLGFTLEETQAPDFRTKVFHPEDLERVLSTGKDALSRGEPWGTEVRIRRKDGQYRWFLIRYNPLRDGQGKIVRWYAAGTDIEDRKQAERELQQLVDAVPQHIVMHSADGRRLYANKVSLDFLGRTLQDFLDDKQSPPFHPDDVASFFEARRRGISSGMPFDMEARLCRNDGKYRWFLFRYSPHRNEQGEITGWYSTGTDIEDRKQAERELNQIVDAVPQHITVLAADGSRLYGNKAALDFHGCTLEEFLPADMIDKKVHPDDLAGYWDIRKRGISSGIPFQTEARLLAKNGQYRWFLFLFNPLRDEKGHLVRWYATATDIEGRKEAEEALRRSEDRLRLLLEFTNKLATKLELRDLLRAVAGSLRKVIACDAIAVFLPHSDGDFLRSFVVDFPESKGFLREELQVSADKRPMSLQYPLAAMVFRTGKEWVGSAHDVLQLGFTNALGLAEGLKTGCVLPILCCDRVLGVLALGRLEPKPFDPYEVELLRQVADQVAIAIVNALAVEDRRQAENALRRSEAYLAEAQRLTHTGSWAYSPAKGGTVYWSEEMFRIAGLQPQQGIPTDEEFLQLVHPEDRGKFLELSEKAVREQHDSVVDYRLLLPGGTVRYIQSNGHPVFDTNKEVMEYFGTTVDITEQRHAEEALRRSETYLAEAQRLSHTGSWAWDFHHKEIIHWSPETYRVFGFDPAGGPVSWHQARSRIHPDDLDSFDKNKERVATERIELEFDFRLIHSDGAIKYAHCVSRPVIDASGEVTELVGSIMDVTEQYQSRAALEKAFKEIKELRDELYKENLALKDEIDQASMFEEIVGTSGVLRRVLVQVAKVAPTDSTVLISGETGTGKELVARAIHRRSQRSSKTFVSVNCGAIPQGLIGSELFGHEKGAFTGATQRRLGRFELADGGTLFLDELGDLPPETQIALLRVLQERQFERVGGIQSIGVNVRVIAATNRDLQAAVAAGTFRSDLFYRLNVFPIAVPALRERKDDIPLLVEYLTERYASKAGKKIKKIDKSTLELFEIYNWPGNIRELQNVIERAVILCDGSTLSVDQSWLQSESPRTRHAANGLNSLARLTPDRERELIESVLAETGGRIAGSSGAAAKLGIPRSTLETKIRKLGIAKHRFKPI